MRPRSLKRPVIPQENAFLQTVILGLVNLGFTVVALVMIDRLGRRPLLLVGTSAMAVLPLHQLRGPFQSATYPADTENSTVDLPDATAQAMTSAGRPAV